jgi:hypothetical protein
MNADGRRDLRVEWGFLRGFQNILFISAHLRESCPSAV